MSVLDLYHSFRESYPLITVNADKEYSNYWGEFENDNLSAHVWFESLANALNKEMIRGVAANTYKSSFEFMCGKFLHGSEDVRKCIDVAFTENLFWQVPRNKAQDYWLVFPDTLKALYVNYHGATPA